MAKKLGLLNSDGTPTDIYKAFRNPTTLKASIAEAIKIGYRELFDRNEYAGSASKDEFRGLVVEVTGLDLKDPVFGMICRTFDALKSLADFEQKLTAPRATDSTETTMEEVPIEASTSKSGASSELDLRLSYTINLVLPKTDDPAVFSAIFKSLGHVDYQDFEPQLRRLDQLLRASGVGKSFAAQSRARYDEPFPAAKTKARARPQQHSYRARRCNVLKGLRGKIIAG